MARTRYTVCLGDISDGWCEISMERHFIVGLLVCKIARLGTTFGSATQFVLGMDYTVGGVWILF